MSGRPLDPRAWLLWALAASFPPLVGRNPFALAATLLAVLGVWAAWREADGFGWGRVLRLGAILAAVGVAFNVLTAHVGDRPFARLPAAWPVVGGPLTLNALVYGVLGGAAVLSLLLVGTTLGAVLDWVTLVRLLPERLAAVAVATSVAWALVPRTALALREIREAQAARGWRPRGPRAVLPLLIPLLAGGLERSTVLAEALEARAFGAPLRAGTAFGARQAAAVAGALALAVVGVYAVALGNLALAAGGLLGGVGLGWLGLRERPDPGALHRTRYREPVWGRAETIVAATAAAALLAQVAVLARQPGAFAYDPYPSLPLPVANLPLLAALGLLLAPALVDRP